MKSESPKYLFSCFWIFIAANREAEEERNNYTINLNFHYKKFNTFSCKQHWHSRFPFKTVQINIKMLMISMSVSILPKYGIESVNNQ